MEEKKSMLKVHVSGMVDGKEIKEENYEGMGIMVLVDTGDGVGVSVAGEWGAVSVGTAIECMKKGVGTEMFKDALGLYLANIMVKKYAGDAGEEDPEEAENERKAAAAAGEAQNGAEA